jgi:TonB family protein
VPLCRRALTIREKALGAQHKDVAAALNKLGTLYLYTDTGDSTRAKPLFERARKITEAAYGAHSTGLAPDDEVECDVAPELVSMGEVVYPVCARRWGVHGDVEILVLVGEDGRVKNLKIRKSVAMLDEPAAAAVSQAVFRPARNGAHPVALWVVVPITFSLDSK